MGFANKLGGFFGGMALGAIDSANKHMPMMFQHNLRKKEREKELVESRAYQQTLRQQERDYQEGITAKSQAHAADVRAETRGYAENKAWGEWSSSASSSLGRINQILGQPPSALGKDFQKTLDADFLEANRALSNMRTNAGEDPKKLQIVKRLDDDLKAAQNNSSKVRGGYKAYTRGMAAHDSRRADMLSDANLGISPLRMSKVEEENFITTLRGLGVSEAQINQRLKITRAEYGRKAKQGIIDLALKAGTENEALGYIENLMEVDPDAADKLRLLVSRDWSSRGENKRIAALAKYGTDEQLRKAIEDKNISETHKGILRVSLAASEEKTEKKRRDQTVAVAMQRYDVAKNDYEAAINSVMDYDTDLTRLDAKRVLRGRDVYEPDMEYIFGTAKNQLETMYGFQKTGEEEEDVVGDILAAFRGLLRSGMTPDDAQYMIDRDIAQTPMANETREMLVTTLDKTYAEYSKDKFENRLIVGERPPESLVPTEAIAGGPTARSAGGEQVLYEQVASWLKPDPGEWGWEKPWSAEEAALRKKEQAQQLMMGSVDGRTADDMAKERWRNLTEAQKGPPPDPYDTEVGGERTYIDVDDPNKLQPPQRTETDETGAGLFETRPPSEATYVDEERAGEQVQNGEEEVAKGVGGRGPGEEKEYDEYIARGLSAAEEEHKESLDFNLVDAVILAESSGEHFDPKKKTGVKTSGKDAVGYMQLRKAAAEEAGVDRFDPEDNVKGGIDYLVRMKQKARKDHGLEDLDLDIAMLMMFNWGPGNFKKWWSGKKTIPRETRNYVTKILGEFHDIRKTKKARKVAGGAPDALEDETSRVVQNIPEPWRTLVRKGKGAGEDFSWTQPWSAEEDSLRKSQQAEQLMKGSIGGRTADALAKERWRQRNRANKRAN